MYASVRNYENVPDPAEVGRQITDSFVSQVTGVDGFVAYFLIDTGGGTMTSVTITDDSAGAEDSVVLAPSGQRTIPGSACPQPAWPRETSSPLTSAGVWPTLSQHARDSL